MSRGRGRYLENKRPRLLPRSLSALSSCLKIWALCFLFLLPGLPTMMDSHPSGAVSLINSSLWVALVVVSTTAEAFSGIFVTASRKLADATQEQKGHFLFEASKWIKKHGVSAGHSCWVPPMKPVSWSVLWNLTLWEKNLRLCCEWCPAHLGLPLSGFSWHWMGCLSPSTKTELEQEDGWLVLPPHLWNTSSYPQTHPLP